MVHLNSVHLSLLGARRRPRHMHSDDTASPSHFLGAVGLIDTHAEGTEALALSMVVEPVGRLVRVDRKVDPDADIPVRLRLSLKDGGHSRSHLLAEVLVPLLVDHAPDQVLVRLLLLHHLAACDAGPMVAQRYFRKLHFAMLPMAGGEQGLKGPVVSVGHREP